MTITSLYKIFDIEKVLTFMPRISVYVYPIIRSKYIENLHLFRFYLFYLSKIFASFMVHSYMQSQSYVGNLMTLSNTKIIKQSQINLTLAIYQLSEIY